jgi:hypothetical protein
MLIRAGLVHAQFEVNVDEDLLVHLQHAAWPALGCASGADINTLGQTFLFQPEADLIGFGVRQFAQPMDHS